MSHPQVVNVRTAPKGSYLYIGRPMPGRFAGSIYANPFSHNSSVAGIQKVATREEAVECYRKWLDGKLVIKPLEETLYRIIDSIPLLARHLDQGGKLGCWCAPQRCHGEALIEFVEATLGRKLAPAVGGATEEQTR